MKYLQFADDLVKEIDKRLIELERYAEVDDPKNLVEKIQSMRDFMVDRQGVIYYYWNEVKEKISEEGEKKEIKNRPDHLIDGQAEDITGKKGVSIS